ncbi:MAG: hypothetical protein D8M54_10735, partial [Chloroflexi bacterium]|nr:hypothetical protein [Chloroflexota bacterium]
MAANKRKLYSAVFIEELEKDMIKLSFTPEIINQLHHERIHHSHPRVRQRMETVYLRALSI